MFVQFDFATIQLRYLKAAMDRIPSFRPDQKTPAEIQALIDSAAPVRAAWLAAKTTLDGARATRRARVAALHGACVDFYQQALNTFRRDPTVSECLAGLPVRDKTFPQTLARAEAVLALWALLPPVGLPPAAFEVTQVDATLDLPGMVALRDAALVAQADIPVQEQYFNTQTGLLHAKLAEMTDQVASALVQGRSQFPPGTPEREIIAAIPLDRPRKLPGKAVIDTLAPDGPGRVRLACHASRATRFDVWMRAPGAEDFTQVAEDVPSADHEVTGLAAGAHVFYVRGRNAHGTGAGSEPVEVTLP